MGKSYHTGVPGLNEQFAPIVMKSVQRTMSYNRKHRSTPDSMGLATVMFIIGLPFLPIWSGMMMIGEAIQMTRYKPGTPQHEEKQRNVVFATVCFFAGIILYSWLF